MKAAFAYLALVGAALAEEPLPEAMACTEAEIARFERDLSRARSGSYKGLAHYVDARAIDVCGVGGIMLCDAADAPLPCQRDLAVELEGKRWEILASLPERADTSLYAPLLAVAKGQSAGDDCAGMTAPMAAWCEAREAARRLELAALAYQVARNENAVAPAYELGWASAPAPTRPRARSDSDKKDD